MNTHKTILQAEDDSNDVCLLRHALHKAGIECDLKVVTDGREAVNYLEGTGLYSDRTKSPWPDLVLLDLKLPRLMGFEVLEWIRHTFGTRLIVVVFSASGLETDIEKAYALGANAFLTKPAKLGELQSMLKATCDFWFQYNRHVAEATSDYPTEGVVSLGRLGTVHELFPLEVSSFRNIDCFEEFSSI